MIYGEFSRHICWKKAKQGNIVSKLNIDVQKCELEIWFTAAWCAPQSKCFSFRCKYFEIPAFNKIIYAFILLEMKQAWKVYVKPLAWLVSLVLLEIDPTIKFTLESDKVVVFFLLWKLTYMQRKG